MIRAIGKPIEEIIGMVKDYSKLLIAGCDGCVTVCEAGGLKEVKVLASALRLYFTQAGQPMEIDETSLTRQCDPEYLAQLSDSIDNYDAVVSLACGCGIQFLADKYNQKVIYPGVDTCFMGVTEERGLYTERCQACGRCILAETGGICPIARCSKRMLNGPCGGSDKGKCEVNPEIDCGWQLIYERLKTLGQLDRFEKPVDPKEWKTSRDGGPRKIVREDLRI
ncbi:MAG: methylenetetrahydrofolate reductase C-terminal domain-containing protein [Thermodesulfobacteriota bacterium]